MDFMVLYWKSPYGFTDTVGPDYSLLMDNSSLLEEKHIFTCFENRSGMRLGSDGEDDNDEEARSGDDDFDWTVGVVIRVFRRPRVPRLGFRDATSHTQRMYEEEPKMLVTGPRQGEMSEKVRLELLLSSKDGDDAPLMLFGAGSAINFIIDALQWCTVNEPARSMISLVYTTRDYDLFQWAMESISCLVPVCEARGIIFDVKMAFTGYLERESMTALNDGSACMPLDGSARTPLGDSSVRMPLDNSGRCSDGGNWTAGALDRSDHSVRSIESRNKSVKTQPMRFDLYGEINPGSTVFCQGSAGLKDAVRSVCVKVGARFYSGRGGAREDLV